MHEQTKAYHVTLDRYKRLWYSNGISILLKRLAIYKDTMKVLRSCLTAPEPDGRFSAEPEQVVAEFAQHLRRSSEYSAATAKAYQSDLAQFVRHLGEAAPGVTVADVTPRVVQCYAETIANLRPATVCRKLSALKTFFDWLWLRGEVASNPVQALRRPRKRAEETAWVTSEDGVALLAACRDDRERAILATYLRAALRYSELVALHLSDVDLVRNELHVVGKGGVRRSVPILSDLRPHLTRWLAVRPVTDHDYLFTTRTGHPLYDKACWRLFRSLLRRAGLESKGYTVHSLRHGAATQMYEAGVDLGTIARFLRHSDMSTVGRYVHAGTEVVRREVEAKMTSSGISLSAPPGGGADTQVASFIGAIVAEVLSRLDGLSLTAPEAALQPHA